MIDCIVFLSPAGHKKVYIQAIPLALFTTSQQLVENRSATYSRPLTATCSKMSQAISDTLWCLAHIYYSITLWQLFNKQRAVLTIRYTIYICSQISKSVYFYLLKCIMGCQFGNLYYVVRCVVFCYLIHSLEASVKHFTQKTF